MKNYLTLVKGFAHIFLLFILLCIHCNPDKMPTYLEETILCCSKCVHHMASHRFLYQSSSGSPLPFHILNLSLHAANSALVLFITESFAVAALFAVHPVHAEVRRLYPGRSYVSQWIPSKHAQWVWFLVVVVILIIVFDNRCFSVIQLELRSMEIFQ